MKRKDQKEIQKFLKDQQEKKILEYCNATGHRIPVTRREFLNAGLISGSAWMLAPTMVQMLNYGVASAQEVDCGDSSDGQFDATTTPLITVSLRGGACMNAHNLPTDEGGELLPSYDSMGRGSPASPTFRTINIFGDSIWFETSSFLRGMIDGVNATANVVEDALTASAAAQVVDVPDPTPVDLPAGLTPAEEAAFLAANDENGDGDPNNDDILRAKTQEEIDADATTTVINLVESDPLAVLSNTTCISVCNRSMADSNQNKFDISSWLIRAGWNEQRKVPIMGNRDTQTGINHNFAGMQPDAPLVVNNIDSIAAAMGAATNTMAELNDQQRIDLFTLVQNLSAEQARNLSRAPAAQVLANLSACATGKNVEAVEDRALNDPMAALFDNVPNVWTNATNLNDDETFGNMVMTVLKGYGSSCGMDMGGYDYHGNDRATTDQRDRNAGILVGRTLRSAAAENRKVMIQVISDGACTSGISDDPEGVGWATDSSGRGMSLIFAFDPAGRPDVIDHQMGNYTTGQVANNTTLIGSDAELAAAGIFANLMAFSGKSVSDTAEAVDGILSASQLASLLKLGS